jgi:hypothetical protein
MSRDFWDLYMLLSMYSEFTLLCGSILLLNKILFKLHNVMLVYFNINKILND